MNLRCLTIQQPWATLIVGGAKRFEIRDWNPLLPKQDTPDRFRGRPGVIGIHAAAGWQCEPLRSQAEYRAALEALGILARDPLPRGKILGTVEWVAVHSTDSIAARLPPQELALGSWRRNLWAWELRNHRKFDRPYTCPGQLGLWPLHFEIPELTGVSTDAR